MACSHAFGGAGLEQVEGVYRAISIAPAASSVEQSGHTHDLPDRQHSEVVSTNLRLMRREVQ